MGSVNTAGTCIAEDNVTSASSRLAPYRGPLTLEQIRSAVVGGDWAAFSREPSVGQRYLQYLDHVAASFLSLSDAVRIDTLGFAAVAHPESGLLMADLEHNVPQQTVFLKPNSFPYATVPGIEHWVVWTLGESDLTYEQYGDIVSKEFVGREFLWFVNPPSRKTVPGIHHCHVFVGNKATV